MASDNKWNDEDLWWKDNFSSRPYSTGRNYEDFRPGYRYGYESGRHHMGRTWTDVEPDLEKGWDRFEDKGSSTWENVKHAVRDAWHKVTGQSDIDANRMSEAEANRSARSSKP